jgi:hypothetical protein
MPELAAHSALSGGVGKAGGTFKMAQSTDDATEQEAVDGDGDGDGDGCAISIDAGKTKCVARMVSIAMRRVVVMARCG